MKRKLEYEDNNLNDHKKQKIYDTCPVCLNDMEEKNYVITNCNHKFCFSCLMTCCSHKNECPLCRAEIKEYNNKKLPTFKNSDMLNNIIMSINNPHYNIFKLIDEIKEIFFTELFDHDEELSSNENMFKNCILRRLERSRDLATNIDLSIMDNIQDFCSKVIIDNSIRMCNWYKNNFE